MSDIEWGAPIEVNGVRPEWLMDDVSLRWYGGGMDDGWWDKHYPGGTRARELYFIGVTAISLPADHPYYLAASRGFTYWPGGESAPMDWDGGDVLWGDGNIEHAGKWDRGYPDYLTVIGYRKRTEQPAPAIAPELVERMVALVRTMADMDSRGSSPGYHVYSPQYTEASAILAELEPDDPDMELAKSINGDVEAIAAAIKAARENGR